MSVLRRHGAAPPVRSVHLGLGAFFRAHQAWFTARDPEWGIAAFAGRRPDLARALRAQDGLFTLVTRAAEGDAFDVVPSVVRAHEADDAAAWRDLLRRPEVAVLTLTVTEAGYRVPDDDETGALCNGAPGHSAVGRVVAGLEARRRAGGAPIAVVPCDNVPDNGRALRDPVIEVAERVDPALAAWIADAVSFGSTVVDRITPATTAADLDAVLRRTGVRDACPVVTEPFAEWVLTDAFPASRPRWEGAGLHLTSDVARFERRKLWLLNGAHSLIAHLGLARGHETVAEAVADDIVAAVLEQWWQLVAPLTGFTADETARYVDALRARFANPRIRHLLRQIAADGSVKLPVRFAAVWRRRPLPPATVLVLAGWVAHVVASLPAPADARRDDLVAACEGPVAGRTSRLLGVLDPALADDRDVVAAVDTAIADLGASSSDRFLD